MANPTLSFSICQANDCLSMVFNETTGAYSANNLIGWNSPNTATSDAVTALLNITDPSNTTFSFDILDLDPSWPTTDSTQEFKILPTDLNQANGKFIDGLYKFQYIITTEESTFQTTVYQFFYCNIQCCVNKMFAKITDPVCDCQADAIAAASKADALLTALIKAAKCGKTSVFNTLSTILNRMCTNINCDSCN